MKNFRKIFLSLMMIIIAVTLLTTASYAWFFMNRKVDATNMNVTVTTPGDLKIIVGHGDASNGSNSISGENPQGLTLAPVSSANGTAFFFADSGKVGNSGEVSGSGYLSYTTSDFQTNYDFTPKIVGYIDYQFTLYNGTEITKAISTEMTYVNVKYGKAMRSAVLIESTPGGAVDNVTFLGAHEKATGMAVTNVNGDKVAFPKNATNFQIPSKSNMKIIIRVWLEGEEDVSINTNLSDPQAGTFNFSATFRFADNI